MSTFNRKLVNGLRKPDPAAFRDVWRRARGVVTAVHGDEVDVSVRGQVLEDLGYSDAISDITVGDVVYVEMSPADAFVSFRLA